MTLDGINLEVVEGDVVRIPAETCQQIQNTGPNDLVFLAVCTPRYDDASYTEPPD